MDDALRLFREQGAAALWDRALGYLDYDLEQTRALQDRLLVEQLRRLQASPLGRQLLGGSALRAAAEFRERVPLTTWDDYDAVLGEQRADVLGEAPRRWVRTSGRTRTRPKWIPLSQDQFDGMNWAIIGAFLCATAQDRGDMRIPVLPRMLNLTAPAPYVSGTFVEAMHTDTWRCRLFPSLESSDLPFEERMALAFRSAVTEGVDLLGGLPSVLASLGETFGQRRAPGTTLDRLRNPRALRRMALAAARARLAGRELQPRDAWKVAGIIVGGMDSGLFRDRIRDTWGRYPLEMFVGSEGLMVGFQGWDFTSLTFMPTLNYLEFIPEDELLREAPDASSQPRTVLMDELEVGTNYELVLTNFLGGTMVRYRTGDIVRVTATGNPRIGVSLPQFVSYGRRSDVIEVAGFVRLTEHTLWRAIEEADVPYVEWTARKEVADSLPVIHLRLEPRPGSPVTAEQAQQRIHEALKLIEPDWADMESIAGLQPLIVTYIPHGAFDRYTDHRRREGADLAHLKPLHMNAADTAIESLLAAAREAVQEAR